MKTYKTQAEVEKDIKNGVLTINDDVTFECDISINASIDAGNINARNIDAWNINACHINACHINARDINARDINAGDISYYAFCNVYKSISCSSIKARREVHHEPVCLDGKLTIRGEEINLSGKGDKMKGKTEIRVSITDETGSFPDTETVTFEADRYLETLDEWVEYFKKILNWAGFHPVTIGKLFDNEE